MLWLRGTNFSEVVGGNFAEEWYVNVTERMTRDSADRYEQVQGRWREGTIAQGIVYLKA